MEEFQYFNQLPDTAVEALIPSLDREGILRLCSVSSKWVQKCEEKGPQFWKQLVIRDCGLLDLPTLQDYRNLYGQNFESWYELYKACPIYRLRKTSEGYYVIINKQLHEIAKTSDGKYYMQPPNKPIVNRNDMVELSENHIIPTIPIVSPIQGTRIIEVSSFLIYIGILLSNKDFYLFNKDRYVNEVRVGTLQQVQLRGPVNDVVSFSVGLLQSIFLKEDGNILIIDNNETRLMRPYKYPGRSPQISQERITIFPPPGKKFVKVKINTRSQYAILDDGTLYDLKREEAVLGTGSRGVNDVKIIDIGNSYDPIVLFDDGKVMLYDPVIANYINVFENNKFFSLIATWGRDIWGLSGRTIYMTRMITNNRGTYSLLPIKTWTPPSREVSVIDMSLSGNSRLALCSDNKVYFIERYERIPNDTIIELDERGGVIRVIDPLNDPFNDIDEFDD